MLRLPLRVTAAGLAFAAFLAAPAQAAPDPADIAQRTVAALAAQGVVSATWENATTDGATVTVTGVHLVRNGHDDSTIDFPVVTLTGVVERVGGGYEAASASFDNGVAIDGARKVTWATATAYDVVVPSPEEVDGSAKVRPFGGLEMTGVAVYRRLNDDPAITAERFTMSLGDIVEGQASPISLNATGVAARSDRILSGLRAAFMRNLGLEEFDFDVSMTGAIDLYADTLMFDPLDISVADLGNFHVSGNFNGVSIGGFLADQRRDTAREQAKLENLTVRFDNRGGVEDALDRLAAGINAEREAYLNNFLNALPFMLNVIRNPPFQARLAEATSTFLRDPQAITFTATPDAPVSLDTILTKLSDDRSALPDLLSAEVTAND